MLAANEVAATLDLSLSSSLYVLYGISLIYKCQIKKNKGNFSTLVFALRIKSNTNCQELENTKNFSSE
jgi:hypothetical protein